MHSCSDNTIGKRQGCQHFAMYPRIDVLPNGFYYSKIQMSPAADSQIDKYSRGKHSFPAKCLHIASTRGRGTKKVHRKVDDDVFEGVPCY